MRHWRKLLLGLVALLLALAAATAIFLHSPRFQRIMRGIVIAQLQGKTGARVTVGQFHFSFRPLAIDMRNVVLHGKEPAGEQPFAQIRHLYLGLTLTSLLHAGVDLRQVFVDHPELHVYVMPDGESNLPAPPAKGAQGPPAETLFQLGIQQLQVQRGELRLQDRTIPLEGDFHNLGVTLGYHSGPNPGGYYTGRVSYGASSITYGTVLPVFHSARFNFALWPNDLRLDAVHLEGENSALNAELMVHNLSAPTVSGGFHLEGDLARWSALQRGNALRAGSAVITGTVRYQAGKWQISGIVAANDLRLRSAPQGLGALSAGGSFRASNTGLTVPALKVFALGGTIALQGKYLDWRNLRASGTVSGMEVARLLRLGGARVHRYISRPLSGVLNGSFQAFSQGPLNPNLQAHVDLHVEAPARTSQALPVNGHLIASVAVFRQTAAIQQLQLALPNSSLQANGSVAAHASRLQVQFTSTDLSQLTPWLASITAPQPPPRLAGSANVTGVLSGTLNAPDFTGTVQASGLHFNQYAADQLQFQGAIGRSGLTMQSLLYRYGGSQITAAGTVGLSNYALTDQSQLNLNTAGRALSVAQLKSIIGKPTLPVSGMVSFQAHIRGTKAAPNGSGQIMASHVIAAGQPVRSVSAQLNIVQGVVHASQIRVALRHSLITGSGSYALNSGALTAHLSSSGVQLEDIAVVNSAKLHPTGELLFTLQAQGTLRHPSGTLTLDTRNLRAGGETLGRVRASVVSNGQVANLNGVIQLPGGRLAAVAGVNLSAPYATNARLTFQNYDIDALLRRFTNVRITGHSEVGGVITLRGPLQNPKAIQADALLNPVHLAIEHVVLTNAGPIHATVANGVLTLASSHIVGTDTDIAFAGTAQLRKVGPIAFRAQGNLNLALLHALSAKTHSSGELVMNADLSGTLRQPMIDGTVEVKDASVAQEGLPVAFDRIEGLLRFSGNRVDIDHLTAQTGGGTLRVLGYGVYNAGRMAYNLTAVGRNLRLLYQGVSVTNDLNLTLTGTQSSGLVSGDVELTRLALTPQFDLAVALANNRTSSAASAPPNAFLSHIRLNVHFITGPQVGFASSIASVQMAADLHIQGTAGSPVVIGRVNAEQGQIQFAGNKYTVSKGLVSFDNPFRIDPDLDVALSTTVQQYNITLNVTGPVDKLNVTYRSDPPLSNTDIISLLATGQTAEHQAVVSQQSATTFVGQGEQLLGQALSNIVASRLQRLFGVTQIQVNPNLGGNAGSTGSGTVTIKQQVSRNLTLVYTQNMTTSSQDIIRVEWTISKHLGLALSRDQFGIYSMSFHFRHRRR